MRNDADASGIAGCQQSGNLLDGTRLGYAQRATLVEVPVIDEEWLECGRLCQPTVGTENVTEWR